MEQLFIEGGNPLIGRVHVGGAKNAVLKLMAASLMTSEECIIHNVPMITDVYNMMAVLRGLGAQVKLDGNGVMRIRAGASLNWSAPDESAREMRASIQVMGPLLARLHRVRIAHPGGCDIGSRPVDWHLQGLRRLGVEVTEDFKHINGFCHQLTGTDIHLDYPSVGATENLMMAACLAHGHTTIYNSAREPEIVEAQHFLNLMGAKVTGAGTGTIHITGVPELGGAEVSVLPDRIEAGTYMVAAAITSGELTIGPVVAEHLYMVIDKLRHMGVTVDVAGNLVHVCRTGRLRPLQMRSDPHPGFPTDLQPQFIALLTQAIGRSIMSENVYSSRFRHVDEFNRMGAHIRLDGRVAIIDGPTRLKGAQVCAWDLRGGAATVIAGLAADGVTLVTHAHHIDRGYEKIEQKLGQVGAVIERRKVAAADEAVLA